MAVDAPNPQILVELCMDATGAKTEREFAKKIGLEGYDAPGRVKNWREGRNKPDYTATMLMLDAAKMLNLEGASEGETSAVSSPGSPLRVLAEAVGALVEANGNLQARLGEVERQLREAGTRPRGRSGNRRAATHQK